jgi:hypothetical protein
LAVNISSFANGALGEHRLHDTGGMMLKRGRELLGGFAMRYSAPQRSEIGQKLKSSP